MLTKILHHILSPFTDPDRKKSSQGTSLFALDGVRGMAVLIVMTSHTSAFGMYGQGSLGVLLFFMLSGFVLTLPYADAPSRLMHRSELYRFAINRILRIMPAYLAAVLFIYWLIDSADLSWLLANISLLKGWNHLWSVVEEARFYLLFPLVTGILALLPNRITRILALAVIIWLSWNYRMLHRIDMMDGRHVSFYFWMFLGGSMVCHLYTAPLSRRLAASRKAAIIFSSAAVLVLLFIFMSSNQMISQFWRPLFPQLPKKFSLNGWQIPGTWFFLFSLLLYSVTVFQNSWPSRLLQSWPLRHLGLLSYSLYLFHMPIMLQMRGFGFKHEGFFIAVFCITYPAALLSYILIEKPFLMLKPAKKEGKGKRKEQSARTAG